MSAFLFFFFSLLNLIGGFRIAVAQRYSVLVSALNDTTSNWAIHANFDTTMFDTVPDTLNPSESQRLLFQQCNTDFSLDATAQVVYSDSYSISTPSTVDEYSDFNDTSLVPVPAIAQYDPPDRTIQLVVFFDTMDNGINRAMFNECVAFSFYIIAY